MKWIGIAIIGLEIIFFVLVIVALIYLIIKRIEDKRNETFEKRDN
jgi:preprotein translocase subunit YajC